MGKGRRTYCFVVGRKLIDFNFLAAQVLHDLLFYSVELIPRRRVSFRDHRDHIDALGELAQRHQVESFEPETVLWRELHGISGEIIKSQRPFWGDTDHKLSDKQ